jgi:hypothetical protein
MIAKLRYTHPKLFFDKIIAPSTTNRKAAIAMKKVGSLSANVITALPLLNFKYTLPVRFIYRVKTPTINRK